MTQRLSLSLNIFATVVLLAVTCTQVTAQLPQISLHAVSPAGGQQGTTFDFNVAGAANDENAHQLIFSHAGITAKSKMQAAGVYKDPRPVPGKFEVTIGKDVPTGVYEVRLAGLFGISNARAFVVGDLPELTDKGGNSSRDKANEIKINSVVNGVVDARTIDYFTFAAKKGQHVLIEALAERIDSRCDVVLTLFDTTGNELDRRHNTHGLDAMIDFTAPADGNYIVGVHDLTYEGGNDHFYRLKLHDRPYIEYVYPPAGMPGKTAKFTLFGRNLPGGKKSDVVSYDGKTLDMLVVDVAVPAEAPTVAIDDMVRPEEASQPAFLYQLNSPQGASNPIRIMLATAPAFSEKEPNNQPAGATAMSIPGEAVGSFGPRRDRDWFSFEAKKGQVLRIETFCHRMGVSADPLVVIERHWKEKDEEKSQTVQTLTTGQASTGGADFDNRSYDPIATWTVPEDGNYRMMVANRSSGRFDPRALYRVAIRPANAEGDGAAADFSLVALQTGVKADPKKPDISPAATLLRRGATDRIEILVTRNGLDADITVTTENLPKGVTAGKLIIPADANSGWLMLIAANDAPKWAGQFKVIGKATVNGKEITRQARGGQVIWGAVQNKSITTSRVSTGVALGVMDVEQMPFTVEVGSAADIVMSRAGKVKIPIKIHKRDGFDADVKIDVDGLPKNEITAKPLTIKKGKADGEIEIDIKANAKLQPHAMVLLASSQIDYRPNPILIDAAKKDKDELTKTSKALTEEAKKAKETAKTASKDAKAEADKRVKELDALVKQAAEEIKKVDAQLKGFDAQTKKPKKVNLEVPAASIMLEVTASPVKVEVVEIKVKQGEKVELPLKLERLYGFDDEVSVSLQAPKGVNIRFEKNLKFEKGNVEIKPVIITDKAAPEGTHTAEVRVQVKFNNQNITQDVAFKITITK